MSVTCCKLHQEWTHVFEQKTQRLCQLRLVRFGDVGRLRRARCLCARGLCGADGHSGTCLCEDPVSHAWKCDLALPLLAGLVTEALTSCFLTWDRECWNSLVCAGSCSVPIPPYAAAPHHCCPDHFRASELSVLSYRRSTRFPKLWWPHSRHRWAASGPAQCGVRALSPPGHCKQWTLRKGPSVPVGQPCSRSSAGQ